MPDSRFFKLRKTASIDELYHAAKLDLPDDGMAANSNLAISGIAPLDKAEPTDLAFFDNIKYRDDFKKTNAGACVLHPDYLELLPDNVVPILSPTPYKTYAQMAQFLYPDSRPEARISDAAIIGEDVSIGQDVVIEPGAVIHDNAVIGDHCWIESNAVIGRHVEIGHGCRIGAGAGISHALIGNHVRLYPGVRIGQDGFGFAIDPTGFVKVPQLGRVVIEDGVEIGANTTIDRGAGPDTVIGAGTWIDNLVQIGHNVKIGRCCVIVAQCGISGSTVLDDFVVLAGQVGIAGHLHIGKGTKIAAKSGVMRDIEPGQEYMGYPALPMKHFMRQVAALRKLIKVKGRV